jgi:hypothetical protein
LSRLVDAPVCLVVCFFLRALAAPPVVLRREIARVGAGRFVALAEEDDAQGLDLGLVPLVPRVLVLPAPRPELALDEDQAALGEVLLAELGQLAEDDDAVPLGRSEDSRVLGLNRRCWWPG